MEMVARGLVAPPSLYEVGGRRFDTASPDFVQAIVDAHASHQRPLCMCQPEGVEMYVARLGEGFIVKRMPNSGSRHAVECPSYEPPAELTGLGQVMGTAIGEDPLTGETTLKLDFPLSKIPGRSTMPVSGDAGDSVAANGTKLTLRGLLHYLWEQAGLTRWHPGFTGRRSWATVRKHLLLAAENKTARGEALLQRLYVPEVFSTDQREAINARRLAMWVPAVARPGRPQQLMLMIAEVKEIVPARYGHKAVIKHVPDQAFAIEEAMYRRIGRRFENELALWGGSDELHLVMIGTFAVTEVGVPVIAELSLMPVTSQWLPVESSFELQLVDKLLREHRVFIKGLRFALPRGALFASALLMDTTASPTPLFIVDDPELASGEEPSPPSAHPVSPWTWNVLAGAPPQLPKRTAGEDATVHAGVFP